METPPGEGPSLQERVNWLTIKEVENYMARGLTMEEASDLVTLENVEQQGKKLTPSETERKQQYLAKL